MADRFEEIRAARRELDAVVAEIQQLDGFEDFLPEPTQEDIHRAAEEQPLVYLSAAEHGGMALVVHDHDVRPVDLPDLTAEAVRTRARAHDDAHRAYAADRIGRLAQWEKSLESTAKWLWDDLMGPVCDTLRGNHEAILVAGGLLGLLPLHAAWTEDPTTPTGRRYALDNLVISYTPNARSLTSARASARKPVERLTVVVDPEGRRPLRSAEGEAHAAAAAFPGRTAVLRGPAAHAEAARKALADTDAVHFACHGQANLLTPLDSSLLLAGSDELRLRDLLTLRLRIRLAVLSACESYLPGTVLPDEVVSLPGGLLQAGVAGVVAAMWSLPDVQAALLMIDFYRRWRTEEQHPATALRDAQVWLRDVPNGEKFTFLQDSLAAGKAWLPDDETIEGLMLALEFQEEDGRSFADLHSWAGFGYFGA
ncbi:CHAT domain-containing protein [Streptomyces europaeiscabiei]|uniref:CHAT domain-containing protein n=1 Tax=Streptomyces europaeiscabiei TaxID=146819 RepID=UPI0029B6734D|nr:CHAT domain-containing protein [Streptomyces europaeiscabiei]MDX3586621.1 CHAT domain-containing protein [Streptomyces europaeiscabiei]